MCERSYHGLTVHPSGVGTRFEQPSRWIKGFSIALASALVCSGFLLWQAYGTEIAFEAVVAAILVCF